MQGILLGLSDVFQVLLEAFQILLLVSAVLSWVSADPTNAIVRLVRSLTDPALSWLRARLPFLVQGAIDFSPLAALLICVFLQKALVFNLRVLAARF